MTWNPFAFVSQLWGGAESSVGIVSINCIEFPSTALIINWYRLLDGQCRRCRRPGFNPWVGNIPWRRKWQPSPVFIPGKFHRPRSLVGYSRGVAESRTWLSEWAHARQGWSPETKEEQALFFWSLQGERVPCTLLTAFCWVQHPWLRALWLLPWPHVALLCLMSFLEKFQFIFGCPGSLLLHAGFL